jgi:holo-[acyl-carrier protein] synthase
MTGVGVDMVEVARIRRLAGRYSADELGLVFSPAELRAAARSRDRGLYLAACFAAKEAYGKALGTGLAGIGWPELEAEVGPGSLTVRPTGRALELAEDRGVRECSASWSAAADQAFAVVVLT